VNVFGLYRRKLNLKILLLKCGRFLLKHLQYRCVITQTIIQQLLNAWFRVLTTEFHGVFVVENVTREWLLTGNEISPCQLSNMRIFYIHSPVIRKIVSRPIADDDDDNDTAGQQRTTENSHTEDCTHTAESTGVT